MSDFKPFDRVLVRDSDDAAWVPGFYSHASGRIDVPYTSMLSASPTKGTSIWRARPPRLPRRHSTGLCRTAESLLLCEILT